MLAMSVKKGVKLYLRILIAVIIFGGVVYGLYLLSFIISPESQAVTLGLIIIPVVIALIWFINISRERHKQASFALVREISKNKLRGDREIMITDVLVPSLEKLGAIDIQTQMEYPPRVAFRFPEGNKLEFLAKASLILKTSSAYSFEGVLMNEYPFSVSIRKETLTDNEKKFYVFSTQEQISKNILNHKEIQSLLLKQSKEIQSITFKRKFISAQFSSAYELYRILEIVRLVYNEINIVEVEDVEIDKMYCYQCEDPFEENEEECTTCGAQRPVCKVCLLDLQLIEKEEVVRTPCCEVYSHKDHMISWLHEIPTCPNCKKDLFLWLRSLESLEESKLEDS
jgi:hypothetical protein